jgi:hypothetical protein
MAGRQTYVITCDGAGGVCPSGDRFMLDHTLPRQLGPVRIAAAAEGWTHERDMAKRSGPTPSRDWCRTCSAVRAALLAAARGGGGRP